MPRYLIIIACFVSALTIGLALLLPKYKEARVTWQEIAQSQQELDYQRVYSAQLKQASKVLAEHQTGLQKIDAALPSQFDLPGTYYYFQKAAAQNGLSLQSISPPSSTKSKAMSAKEINFLLSLSGSYSSLKNFLVALYKSARFIIVESISFSSPGKGDNFNFNVKVRMYSY